ncbi:AMMECR1 domain-containing protein [Sulfuricurvum sp.]|uniref:AMMECR1 domain-containing protein n=1 Tax=Sulfuricurvum sp. TaxID=2025608 RepID=UPI002617FCC5|nr:AMMECR1 domain-containing protein [Sulfuricurvum sp.]MDD2265672.1 AMMECR1 domain-containing protein [Sulfuricurvum sp.]MDD2783597.1 AMMECR1 domain-containing protein [Sulfuricurvum sp.]HZF70960.1 AMMECR1 domain-containing protein [Sulfuricurvum sp.]
MSQSVLLTIARQSIEEVLQAERSIDREKLLEEYPVLNQPMATEITLYLNDKIRGNSKSESPERSLLDDIIHNAKIAAFQDENFDPLVTSEYLHTAIELTLFSAEGPLSHKSSPILKDQ